MSETPTTGADAVDAAIAQGIDLDGTPIPAAKLDLYHTVMAKEAGRQRSGVSNSMRSRIVRIGAKHFSQDDLNQMLQAADFAPLKDKEIAYFYGSKQKDRHCRQTSSKPRRGVLPMGKELDLV
jgi:hypothetical protein